MTDTYQSLNHDKVNEFNEVRKSLSISVGNLE